MSMNKKVILIIVFITVLCNFRCINEPSTDTFYTGVEGIVTDSETGQPIASVFVQAISYSAEENEPPFTYTNEEGFYSFSIKRSELIDMIRYEKKGYFSQYRKFTGKIKTNDDEVIQIDTKLVPAGGCPYIIGIDPDPPEHCYVWRTLHPSWSPDGRYVAYIAGDEDGKIHGLYIYDIINRKEKRILDWADNKSSQAWSPDGKWITFGVGKQIYKIRPDGSGLINLTNNPEREYFFPVRSTTLE